MTEEKQNRESIELIDVATSTAKAFKHSTGKVMTSEEILVEIYNDIKAIRRNI